MRAKNFFAVLSLIAIGCGERHEPEDVVPVDQLPPAALKAAKEQLPGVTFDMAWKEKGSDAFEIRGKTKEGKVRDAKVTSSGKVLEVD